MADNPPIVVPVARRAHPVGNALIGQALVAPQRHGTLDLGGVAALWTVSRSRAAVKQTRCARPRGVIAAFLWMFIRGVLKEVGRLENLHLLSPRVNNLLGSYN